jgi:hypothetical protein
MTPEEYRRAVELFERLQDMTGHERDAVATPTTAQRDYADRAREWLVKFYQQWGKPEKAEEWVKK